MDASFGTRSVLLRGGGGGGTDDIISPVEDVALGLVSETSSCLGVLVSSRLFDNTLDEVLSASRPSRLARFGGGGGCLCVDVF